MGKAVNSIKYFARIFNRKSIFLLFIFILLNMNSFAFADSVLIDNFQVGNNNTGYWANQLNNLLGGRGVGNDYIDIGSQPSPTHPMSNAISPITGVKTGLVSVDNDWGTYSFEVTYNQVYDYYYNGSYYNGYCYVYEGLVPIPNVQMATNWLIGVNYSYLNFWILKAPSSAPNTANWAAQFTLQMPDGTTARTRLVPIWSYLNHTTASGWNNIQIPMNQFLGAGTSLPSGTPITITTANFQKLLSLSFTSDYLTKTNLNNSSGTFYLAEIALAQSPTTAVNQSGQLISNLTYPKVFVIDSSKTGYTGQVLTFNFNLNQTSNIEIKIYNKSGNLIKHINSTSYSAGNNLQINWDANNNAGAPVPPGIYMVLIKAQSGSLQDSLFNTFLLIR